MDAVLHAQVQNKVRKKRKSTLGSMKKDVWLYVFLVPFLAWYLIFAYKPMGGLLIAFKDYSLFTGMADSPWVGLEHFKTFFQSAYFFRTLKNTIILNIMNIALGFPIPIVFAILLNEVRCKALRKSIQTITYLPYFISNVIVARIVCNF